MESSRNVFWGLVIKPGKRYETEVQEPFRITKVQLSTYNYEQLVLDDWNETVLAQSGVLVYMHNMCV